MHFGPQSSRAHLSLRDEITFLWRMRSGRTGNGYVRELTVEEANFLRSDMQTWARRRLNQAREKRG
eukprot:5204384-Pyramimonas_sp.AAC.1